MPIQPAIPFGGLAGLRFLERTLDEQQAVFNSSSDIQREVDYFLETASSITSVDALMGDRRVLQVILGAFGLDEDIDKGAFIRKVIEEGTFDSDSFANRLVEPAYREMSAFLGFGDFGGTLVFENTRLNIVDRFRERQFELAVGDVDLDLRLALNFKREAAKIVAETENEDAALLKLLGSSPLREVVEGALALPTQFGSIDLDQQLGEIKKRAENILGSASPREFLGGDNLQKFIDRFLLIRQATGGTSLAPSPGTTALTLLQSSGLGALGAANLFSSNF